MIFEKEGKILSLTEFEKWTGTRWIFELEFEDLNDLSAIQKMGAKLHKNGSLSTQQLWFGRYFQKEILSRTMPELSIRWISSDMGWGVFTDRPIQKMEFIAEYVGQVRKKRKADSKNSYCFEYTIAESASTPYNIDARERGGVARYINHSAHPNLQSALATFDDVSHVILYAKEPIAKGAQLCYDYGLDYWSKRTAPVSL